MKNKIIFSGVFLITLTIGYFAVPRLIEKLEKPQTLIPVEETSPITQSVSEPTDESIEYDWEYDRKFKTKLLETGEFHTEDLTGKSGETWLGLYQNEKTFKLLSTTILIKNISTDLFDKEVFTNKKGKSIFLIKNAKMLRKGEIQTVFQLNEDDYDEAAQLKNGTDKIFEFNGENYQLRVENKTPSNGEFPSKGSKLILSSNGKSQILTYLKDGCEDCAWSVYWVGDLDRDGKLDFYLDLSEHYNAEDKVLFLSSKAEKNKLVKAVANLITRGC